MLKNIFKYESKLLLRSRWIQLLSIVLLLLFGFSANNGKRKADNRAEIINTAINEVDESDAMMLSLLDSVSQGLEVSVPRWTIPTSPMAVGNYYPRVAAMKQTPFTFIATGQSDMYTAYVKPTVRGEDFALNFTEMTSPVQLLFGSFDLTFVIIYLLPLLIIAFSYNVLSSEKESGTLRLLASQPIKIRQWLFQKLSIRFFWMSVLVVLSMIIIFLLLGIDFVSHIKSFLILIALVLVYMLFWFSLAFLVNLLGSSSAKNAVSILGLWVVFVLLVPSILNQAGNALYPIPSRTLLINEMRTKKADVSKKQDEILDNFLRDHPEYAINDSTQARSFWHRYMASQKLVKEELEPLVNSYELQLQKQQDLVGNLKWISPSLTIQESLNKLAGSSASDFEDFREQVVVFAGNWREHFMPFLYNNREFTVEDYNNLPQFNWEPSFHSKWIPIAVLFLISTFFFGIGYMVSSNKKVMQL